MRSKGLFASVLSVFFALTLAGQGFGAIIRVKWDSPTNGPGNDWDHAYHTVAAGLTAAASGGEVWVARGTYVEHIALKTGVALYGGFAGTELARTARNWTSGKTVIDGAGTGSVVTASYATSATIDGFTIRNGASSGVYCYQDSVQICNNTITQNASGGNGGGILCTSSSCSITNNIIAGNNAANGGGVYCTNSSLTITNNTIVANAATDGAGITCSASSPTISNNIVAFNSAGIRNGLGGTPVLRNNDFYNPAGFEYAGLSAGTGDMSADPRLVSPQYGNYHIQPDSPCIGAGWNGASGLGTTDIDGQPRIQPTGGTVDIGTDESDGTLWTVTPMIVRIDKVNGDDANDGSNWASAKKTIQAGIDAASLAGGEVWVKAGVYTEQLTLPNLVHVYGGFAGTESVRAARNWSANETVLDGAGGNVSVVTALLVGFQQATIDGFTICNANKDGVYCKYASSILSNNRITGNTGSGHGIGYLIGAPVISGNVIAGNAGGGIYCNTFSTGAPVVVNNTIVANQGTGFSGSTAVLSNNIIVGNPIGVNGSSSCKLHNNNVFNPDGRNYSNCSAGAGDISVDPSFATYTFGDYHIQPDSPCIGAGWNGAFGMGATDIDGKPRVLPAGGTVDMGAYESDGAVVIPPPPLTLRVDGVNGNDANEGTSWLLAKRTVQSAINAASASGGEVWVRAGVYSERLTMKAGALVYGGFAGTESTKGTRARSSNTTILDGGALGSVVTASGLPWRRAAIDGFTIRNGKSSYGGGIYCTGALEISNNTIVGNTATNSGGGICFSPSSLAYHSSVSNSTIAGNTAAINGGGIYCSWSSSTYSPTFSKNTITGNSSGRGGGIYCWCPFGVITIWDNAISGNTASAQGGGIYAAPGQTPNSSVFTISVNSISGNSAPSGAGMYCADWTNAVVSGNTIARNSASSKGGGMYFSNCSPAVSNNTVANDTAPSGGGLYLYYSSLKASNNVVALNSSGLYSTSGSPVLRNNCVYNPAGYNYSGLSAGTGDTSVAPMFVNAAGGDYHLKAASPCIDAGWDSATGIPATDMDGEARVNGVIDIGADEYWLGPARTVSDAKAASDTSPVSLYGGVVSAVFGDSFYVESDDRTSGMLVKKSGHSLQAGNRARVLGYPATNLDSERFIDASTADATGIGSVAALGMPNRSVGGGTCGSQSGVWGWVYTVDSFGKPIRIWDRVQGLNNIGLLISTCGRVTGIEPTVDPAPTWFTIDDGGALDLKCTVASGVTIDPTWQYVRVTGVSSCEKVGSELHAVVRVRGQADIVAF